MEEFDYSVQISDQDWDSFFQDCEECRLLSPSLAGLEESGMSDMGDMDDMGSLRTAKDMRVHVPVGLLAGECSIDDGPPHCEGSPVEHRLCKYGVGGMENVLSGSEEDLHLQSVNTFFEGLRFLTEAERLTEPSQIGVGKNPEPVQEEEMWRDGPAASMGTVPKSNIPELNSVAADSGTTTSKETTDLVNIKSIENVVKKGEHDFKIVCFGASNSQIEALKSTNAERELFIREVDLSMKTAAEVRKQTPSHESPDEAVRSGKSPDRDELLSSDMNISKWVNDVRQGDVLSEETALNKKHSVESPTPLEVMSKCKLEKGRDVTLPSPDADPKNLNSGVSQACSPSPSTKKKRRKKKRVSFGPVETGHGYTRPFIANESDSDCESCIWGRVMDPHFSGNNSVSHWNKTEKNVETSIAILPTHWQAFQRATTHNLSLTPMENKVHIPSSTSTPLRDWQYQNLSEMFDLSECPILTSKVTDARCKATDSSGIITSTDRTATPIEGSTELNKAHWLPVSNSIGVTSKLELDTEMAACNRESLLICEEGEDTHGVSLKQPNEMNGSNTAQATSVTQSSVSESQGSNNPALKSGQSHKESTGESNLPVEVTNFGKGSTGQSEAESPQHLAMNCHDKAQCRCTSEKTSVPVSTVVMIGSDPQHLSAQETMQLKNGLHVTHSENQPEVSGANLTPDSNDMSSPESISCYLDENNETQLTKISPAVKSSTEPDFSEIMVSSIPHEMNGQNEGYLQSGALNHSSTINNQSQNNSNSSTSDNLLISQSNITPNGSLEDRLVLNKEPMMEFLDESVTSMSNNTGSSVCPNNISGHGENVLQITVKNEGNEVSDLQDTSEQTCHSESTAEDAVTTFETENDIEIAPDSKHSVFAISSFWNEMEKLTIKDIMGLRNALPDSSLPLSVDSDHSDGTDSGYFTQLDGSKPDQTSGDMSSISNVILSNSDPVMASSNSMAVMWVTEPDSVSLGEGIYPENVMTRSVSDLPEPLLSSSSIVQKYPKKMPKNISVHNLPALESEPCVSAWRGHTLSPIISEDGEVEIDYFERIPRRDSGMESLPPPSFTEHVSAQSNGISFTNILAYFFGGKQSKPIPSDTYSLPPCHIGDSVPETYDHFFSEFDTGSVFSPLTVATGQSKDELVSIFSTNRNLQFPEGYEGFFPSSSSDEDEDDNEVGRPIQVVTRLSQKANEALISSDIYENFFTDGDQHNFFWKNTFSLRNICFTSSVSQNQITSSLTVVPVKQTSGSVRRTIRPIGMLGNHDAPFPDPLLCHLDDMIIRQLAEQPLFKYDDLQTAVANPRLDSPFLTLRQSDMCLVCIAFASWVLKSANPQVGDAWKAVLLANISALSAIRYLRKYVRKEASGEKTSSHNND